MDPEVSIDDLVDRFVKQLRNGSEPSIDSYVKDFPQHEEQIEKLFPMLQLMEARNENSIADLSSETLDNEIRNLPPLPVRQSIGDYRIVRELGRGGMGIVYLAEQESLGRSVAIKILPESAQFDQRRVQRFQQEAKASGKLHHSNIVPVFDVGREDDISFLVMQYIDGVSLDHVLRKIRGDSAPDNTMGMDLLDTAVVSNAGDTNASDSSTDQSIDVSREEFVAASAEAISSGGEFYRNIAKIGSQISEALAYAHRENVLHRDIKPGNLMLDSEGHAWITDFGLAKILDDVNLTKTGETVGTLRYVSPEQLRGFSDARSDIYSLGLTLYELLTLRPAFKGSDFAEIIQKIGEQEPTRPRQIDSRIPRDLETIVLTAIDKDPQKRYQSAVSLHEDLQRFLSGKPIKAKQASELEKFVKAVKRRPAVSALASLLLVSLIVGAALTTWKWREATNALAIAKQEAKSREGINNFFIKDLLGQANPTVQPDPDVRLTTVLRRAAKTVDRRFRDDPKTEAEIRFQIGRVFYSLAQYKEALEHYRESFEIRRELLGEDHWETMQVLFRVGKAEMQLDRCEEAIEKFDRVVEFYLQNQSVESANLFNAMFMKAGALSELGRLDEAEKVAQEFVEYAYEDDYLDLKNGMERLANIYFKQRKYAKCEAMIVSRIKLSEKSSRTLSARNILALCQMAQGDVESGRKTFAELLKIQEKELGKEHEWTMIAAKNYADALQRSGQYEESLAILDEYLPLSKRIRGVTNRHTVSIEKLMAKVLMKSGSKDAGMEILESLRANSAKVLGESDRKTIGQTTALAWEHRKNGDFQKAATMFESAYEAAKNEYGKTDRLTLVALADLGDVNRKLKNYELSEEYLVAAIEAFRKTVDETDPDLLLSIRSLVKLYLKIERLDEAETLATEIVDGYTSLQGIDSAATIDAMEFLKDVYFEQGNNAAAKKVLTRLYELASSNDPFGEKAMAHFFELDYANAQLEDQQTRIDSILKFCESKESTDQRDGNYWKARGLLGQAYFASGDLKAAEDVLLKAHEGLESIRDEVEDNFYRKYMGRTAGRLEGLYDELKDEAKRDHWYRIYRSFRD